MRTPDLNSDSDARDLLMEFGYSGTDATRAVKEQDRIELCDPGSSTPQFVITRRGDGQWAAC